MACKHYLCFIIGLVLLGAASPASPPQSSHEKAIIHTYAPYVAWTGSYSSHADRGFFRITEAAEWSKLWEAHRGDQVERDSYRQPVFPQIDFKACLVIAAFEGPTWNVRGETFQGVDEFEDRVRIRIERSSYQTLGPDGGGECVTPYAIYVFPRISKPIEIEMNTQDLIGQPPIWTQQARFEAMHGN